MTDVKAQSEDHAPDQPHPSTFSPATFALLIVLAIFGAIIGIQLILQLGVTPNTSIIGALVAMILARLPLKLFARYRSVHVQNLAQSNISAATFGAANSLLVPIGVPFLLGRGDLILPMLVGAALAMLLDAYLLYTGVTRGKRLVVLVGQKKAVAIAVRNVSGRRRWSKLAEWLRPGPSISRRISSANDALVHLK